MIRALKATPQFQFISLPKFTNCCIQLNLVEELRPTLRKMGKNDVIKMPTNEQRIAYE